MIIVVFVFSFRPRLQRVPGRAAACGGHFAAKVNGETIPYTDYQLTYDRYYKDYQSRAGGAFTPELAKQTAFAARSSTSDRPGAARQAALEHGVAVSDRSSPRASHKTFGGDEKFDEETYRLIVERQLGMATWQYEEQERRRLSARDGNSSILATCQGLRRRGPAEFAPREGQARAHLRALRLQRFKADAAKPDDAAVEAFVKDNGPRIEEAYKTQCTRFHKPKRVKARHILLKVDEKATDAQAEEVKKKLADPQGQDRRRRRLRRRGQGQHRGPGQQGQGRATWASSSRA
jgi:peptidyl-prolyl cis-trans isomerase D